MSTLSDGNATSSLTVSVVLCGCAEGGECIEVTTPNFGAGSYYQERCRCNPAYEGMLCENDIDGCKENPCQDPSLCEDVPAPGVGFNCTGCLEGYQLSRNMCDGKYIISKLVLVRNSSVFIMVHVWKGVDQRKQGYHVCNISLLPLIFPRS